MLNIKIDIDKSFSRQLDKYVSEIQEKVLLSGVSGMASVIYENARLYAEPHVKSGLLQSSIYRTYAKDESTKNTKIYKISWNKSKAPHGHLIEFGTSRAPAYPFIRPAFGHIGDAIAHGLDKMRAAHSEIDLAK